jgi:tRNA(fMet)-specific endonuclease VapC
VSPLIDTTIAIYLRDKHRAFAEAIAQLPRPPMISVLTRVELESGVYRSAADAELLRRRLDVLLGMVDELPFTSAEADVYGQILKGCGYSRARVIDRMIAATAIVADATLITINGADFKDIPGLKLEVWPSPGL